MDNDILLPYHGLRGYWGNRTTIRCTWAAGQRRGRHYRLVRLEVFICGELSQGF